MSSPSHRRVVVTGVGMISPLGNSRASFWHAIHTRTSGIRNLTLIPTHNLPIHFGGEAADFTGDIADFGPLEPAAKKALRKGLKVMCREIQMGVAASQLALTDADLAPGMFDPNRTGIVYGSDYIMTNPDEFSGAVHACMAETGSFDLSRWAEKGIPKITPLWLLKYLPNMPACHVAIHNDLRGPSNSITVREASSNLALAEAACTIARGDAEIMVSGATGSRIHAIRTLHVVLQEELACGETLAESLPKPFDLARRGMVVGEGAASLVLEERRAAEARGARILGEIVGYGSSAAINRDGSPRTDVALRNAMAQALRTARMAPDEVGHLHAHGACTTRGDIDEAKAIREIFGGRASPVPVTALKSYLGNVGAAGGALELTASMLAMAAGELPPILNYVTPDPACPISAVTQSTPYPPGRSVMNVSITPQGQASAIVFRNDL